MITKKQFCEYILDKFCEEEDITPEQLEEHVTKSSSACVAAEYLGLLKTEELREYASERAGLYLTIYVPEPATLTTREFIDLLPE